jgi:tripartite-type tricarboxylate transporter receptor subunit TctC
MIARGIALLAALLTCAVGPAVAQTPYPKGPVRMIVPFPPGGPTDITARTLGTRLGEVLGQPIVVENRAGARGFIGIEAAARAPADGHTLLLASIGAIAINPVLYPKVPCSATSRRCRCSSRCRSCWSSTRTCRCAPCPS